MLDGMSTKKLDVAQKFRVSNTPFLTCIKQMWANPKYLEMYIKVQWFSLMLKVNIYFEFTSYALYFIMLASFDANWAPDNKMIPALCVSLIILILILPSLILSRYAISKESNILMTSFIVFQVLFIGSTIFVMIQKKEYLTDWYAFTGYCKDEFIFFETR